MSSIDEMRNQGQFDTNDKDSDDQMTSPTEVSHRWYGWSRDSEGTQEQLTRRNPVNQMLDGMKPIKSLGSAIYQVAQGVIYSVKTGNSWN